MRSLTDKLITEQIRRVQVVILPARGCKEGCCGDGRDGRVFLVVVRDAFIPLQVHDAERSQRNADPKEYQTHIKPPAVKEKEREKRNHWQHVSDTIMLWMHKSP